MNFSKTLAGILGTVAITFLLLLIEWYVAAIAFFIVALALVLLFALAGSDPAPRKPQDRRTTRRNSGSAPAQRRWNGFTDPDDFPTDGLGNGGW